MSLDLIGSRGQWSRLDNNFNDHYLAYQLTIQVRPVSCGYVGVGQCVTIENLFIVVCLQWNCIFLLIASVNIFKDRKLPQPLAACRSLSLDAFNLINLCVCLDPILLLYPTACLASGRLSLTLFYVNDQRRARGYLFIMQIGICLSPAQPSGREPPIESESVISIINFE